MAPKEQMIYDMGTDEQAQSYILRYVWPQRDTCVVGQGKGPQRTLPVRNLGVALTVLRFLLSLLPSVEREKVADESMAHLWSSLLGAGPAEENILLTKAMLVVADAIETLQKEGKEEEAKLPSERLDFGILLETPLAMPLWRTDACLVYRQVVAGRGDDPMEPIELDEDLAQHLGQYARLLRNGKGPLVREFAERYGEYELPGADGGARTS
ncbi:hypothetical protein PG997_000628 [Apiospora hydei]|uniref:Uncharacterized protein n=1 Tax=Apiospora hydei TaxID=1337664 RepID=A0ABR1XBH8_9PEZI